jgi:peptidyl-prolyl cis-trans isomerase D
MLAAIRDFAKSWPAKILMGLLAISFVTWGVNQAGFTGAVGDHVVKAGDRTISSLEFRREYDNYRNRLQEQTGQTITTEMAQENNLDAVVLNGVATREAFAALLTRVGIRPSDKLLVGEIEKMQGFFDPITGRFDRKTYEQRLDENGLTPEMFEAVMRDEMAAQHWAVAVQNGLVAPRAYGAMAAVFGLESRDLAFFVMPPQSVPRPAMPTDAQLTAFINENKQVLTVPETRVLTVVPFTPQAAEGGVGAIDPAELQKRYEFRKDTLSQPETRTVVQIPVKDQAAAQAVATRLRAGEDPQAIAKSIGVDAVTFEDRPLTAISDRKVGQAAFKMVAGEVAPVQGDLGLSVVKVVSVTPGREVTLEEARPMLEAEIRKDMVAEKVYEQTQAYEDAHQAGASLAEAAEKAGIPTMTIGPITAEGVDAQGRQLQGLPPKILETAFALTSGGESDIVDLGDGAYFAVRVERVTPAAVPPLEEIRADVTRAWMNREVVRALEAKATELSTRIQKGESLEAVASSAGYTVTRVPGLTRQNAQQRQDLGNEILGRAFSAKTGEVWQARAPTGLAVGRVEKVGIDPGVQAAQIAEQNRGPLAQVVAREMSEAARNYARTEMKVKMDRARARSALGFEPLEEAPAEKKK